MDRLEIEVQAVGGPGTGGFRRSRRIALAIALLVTAGVVLAGIAGWLPGPPVARPARILVVDAAGALATVAADGSDRRPFAVEGAAFEFPAWSPDGHAIAAIGTQGGDGGEGAVYVFDDRGTTPSARAPVVVYPPSTSLPIYASWSPDGRRIGILTSETASLALRIVAADGAGESTVVHRGQPLYWDWIDGSHLLVHSGGSGPAAMVGEVGLDGQVARVVSGDPGAFQAPGVAPGGDERAFVTGPVQGEAQVVVVGPTGTTLARSPVNGGSALGWSPRGDLLAFTAPSSDNALPYGSLELLDPVAGQTRTLLDGFVIAFFWSPDGHAIAAIRIVRSGERIASLRPVAAAGTTALELTLVDVSTGIVGVRETVRLPDPLVSQFLPFFDQYALSHRIWSPDSSSIVLPLVDDTGESRITLIPADGSPSHAIADGVAAFWSP